MKAFVLVEVPPKCSWQVSRQLKNLDEIEDVWILYGEHDLIALANVEDIRRLDNLIMKEIQQNKNVRSTRTFIVVEAYDNEDNK